MRAPTMIVATLVFFASVPFLDGQDRQARLPARTVTLRKEGIDVEEALAAIREQAGIVVPDRRSTKGPARFGLDLDKATFWQGLEAIARQADARISLYQDDGKIALVNGPYRSLPTSHHGIFRTAVRRLAVARNLETATDVCSLELETAWEPWFRPFLMEVGPVAAGLSGPMNRPMVASIPGQGRMRVAGRSAIAELRMPAPPRSVQKIDSLKGSFKLIGPTKMLVFRFEDLKSKPKQAVVARQEGVKIELARVIRQPDRWSFDILIDNPPGGPTFESHQAHCWLDNNRIYLQKGEGKSATIWPHSPDEQESDKVTEARAAITYHFPLRGRLTAQIGKLEDWSLVYATPGPIIETKVEYSFTDLLLP